MDAAARGENELIKALSITPASPALQVALLHIPIYTAMSALMAGCGS